MDNLVIEGTERSPEIRLDVGRNHLSISGESYPEDTFVFFEPILDRVQTWLRGLKDVEAIVDIRLVYFNSSSAKALMNLLEMLDAAAARPDVRVCVNWHYQDQDDMMQELGEEFAEDLKNVRFELVVV
jgi:hypothetical protein